MKNEFINEYLKELNVENKTDNLSWKVTKYLRKSIHYIAPQKMVNCTWAKADIPKNFSWTTCHDFSLGVDLELNFQISEIKMYFS